MGWDGHERFLSREEGGERGGGEEREATHPSPFQSLPVWIEILLPSTDENALATAWNASYYIDRRAHIYITQCVIHKVIF